MTFKYTHGQSDISVDRSAVIKDMLYNEQTRDLYIGFHYPYSTPRVYHSVDVETWLELSAAESYGQAYNSYVKYDFQSSEADTDLFEWVPAVTVPEPEVDVVDEDYVREKEGVVTAADLRENLGIEHQPDATPLQDLITGIQEAVARLTQVPASDIDTDFYTDAVNNTESTFLVRFDNHEGFGSEWTGYAATEDDVLAKFWELVVDDVTIVSVTRYF